MPGPRRFEMNLRAPEYKAAAAWRHARASLKAFWDLWPEPAGKNEVVLGEACSLPGFQPGLSLQQRASKIQTKPAFPIPQEAAVGAEKACGQYLVQRFRIFVHRAGSRAFVQA